MITVTYTGDDTYTVSIDVGSVRSDKGRADLAEYLKLENIKDRWDSGADLSDTEYRILEFMGVVL